MCKYICNYIRNECKIMELFLNKFITFFQFYVRVSLGHGGRLNGIRDNYTHELTIVFWLFLVLLRRCRAHTSTHIFTDKHTVKSQMKVNHIFVVIFFFSIYVLHERFCGAKYTLHFSDKIILFSLCSFLRSELLVAWKKWAKKKKAVTATRFPTHNY